MDKEIIHKAYILFLSGIMDENGIVKVNDNEDEPVYIKFIDNDIHCYVYYLFRSLTFVQFWKNFKLQSTDMCERPSELLIYCQ